MSNRTLVQMALAIAVILIAAAGAAQTVTVGSDASTGTVVVTQQAWPGSSVTKVTIAWTSDADTTAVLATLGPLVGAIERVVTNPDDTDAPTDNYDIKLTDEDGMDLFAGLGCNCDTADSEHFVPYFGDGTLTDRPIVVAGDATLTVENAGAEKAGIIRIYLRRL